MTHEVQEDEPRELANWFRGHAVQLDAPAAEKKPAVQKGQDFWPDLSWNLPAVHGVQSEPSTNDPGWQTQSNPVLGAAWSTQAALAWHVAPMQLSVSTHTLASLYEYPTLQAQTRSEVSVGRVSWNSLAPQTVRFLQEAAMESRN